jgi:hypothetical protein
MALARRRQVKDGRRLDQLAAPAAAIAGQGSVCELAALTRLEAPGIDGILKTPGKT